MEERDPIDQRCAESDERVEEDVTEGQATDFDYLAAGELVEADVVTTEDALL